MCEQRWISRGAGGMALALGLAYAPWAAGNGGPFVINYPGGDPAAKGVLARIDPDLKPRHEDRLRVVKEDLKVLFMQDQRPPYRPNAAGAPGVFPGASKPIGEHPLLEQQPPLAVVSAIYTIENPTEEAIEVEFGFPILRGVYLVWGMAPSPAVQVRLDAEHIRPDFISNSMIYGLIRQRAQAVIDRALAADPDLARLVSKVRTTGYVRQRAREAILRVTSGQDAVLKAVQADPSLSTLIAAKSDAADPDRTAARQALMDYLTRTKGWEKGPVTLLVEYASMELGGDVSYPPDASPIGWGGNLGDMNRLARANLGRLGAIGEQKTTQLFAELAARFDPGVKTAYEAIFTAWGGDVRERSVDLQTGKVRPRELSLDPKLSRETLSGAAAADPTLYARMDYINPGNLTEGEKASCEAVIKNLPVTFTFAPMNLLHYKAKFPARSTRTLTVTYSQYAYADTHAPASFQLAYVVHPASLWKQFGPIELEVAVPEGLEMKASVDCRKAGVEERELPKDLAGISSQPGKVKVALHRGTVTEKTGELFLAVAAEGWNKLTESKPNGRTVAPGLDLQGARPARPASPTAGKSQPGPG